MFLLAQLSKTDENEDQDVIGQKITRHLECLKLGEKVLTVLNKPNLNEINSIRHLLNNFAAIAHSKDIESLAAICYVLEHALARCSQNSKQLNLDLCNSIGVTCPECELQFNARVYSFIHSDSPVATMTEKINMVECPYCDFNGRLNASIAFCDPASGSLHCYLNNADYHEYEKTEKINWLEAHLASLSQEWVFANITITDQIEDFLTRLAKLEGDDSFPPETLTIHTDPSYGISMGVFRQLGASYFEHKLYDMSAHIYELAVRYDPLEPTNYAGLAAAYTALDKTDDAKAMLELSASIEKKNDDKKIMFELSSIDKKAKSQRKAVVNSMKADPELYTILVEELQTYMKRFPDDQQMCFFLGSILMELNQPNEMIRSLLKTIAIQPNHSQIARGAQLVLNMKSDKDQLAEYLREQLT
jgi:tetratricopeptide (TPR) repeat protein